MESVLQSSCSNIERKSLKNTYLNITEILFLLFIFSSFSNNIDQRKQDFLSEEKISDSSRFVNKELFNNFSAP